MIELPEILGTVAEIVITMAGFMGVIVAFNWQGVRARETYYRIQWTFALALVVLVALLAPHILVDFSDAPSIVLGLPLAFLGIAYIPIIALGLWQQATGKTVRTGSKLLQGLLFLVTGLVLVTLFLSALDIVIPRSTGVLVLAAVWSICLMAFNFITSIWQGTLTDDP